MQSVSFAIAILAGVGIGIVLGLAIDNIGAGISIGIAGSAAICGVFLAVRAEIRARRKRKLLAQRAARRNVNR